LTGNFAQILWSSAAKSGLARPTHAGQDHHKDDQMQHKPGAYTLKLGVLDHTTNLIGTTVTRVTVQ
jgi:hypothetical protein